MRTSELKQEIYTPSMIIREYFDKDRTVVWLEEQIMLLYKQGHQKGYEEGRKEAIKQMMKVVQ